MVDPTTVNKLLAVPTRGSDSGTWDTPVNNDFTAIDGMFGGITTVSLSSSNVTLTAPTGSVTPGAGPNQSQNAVIKFTGVLTAQVVITLTLPGFYIFHNQCTGNFAVIIAVNGVSTAYVSAPPGRACHVYFDGTNTYMVNDAAVGSYMDLAVATVPAWISAPVPNPWLRCDGTVYSMSTYPVLGAILGSTFGGNGSTTFGVPALGNKIRLPVGGGLITVAGGNFDGATLGQGSTAQNKTLAAANLPASIPYTDPGHVHGFAGSPTGPDNASLLAAVQNGPTPGVNAISSATTGIIINQGSANTPVPIVQPSLVACMTFIKT